MNASRYSIICLVNFIPGTDLNTGRLSYLSIIGASSPPTIPGRGSFTGNVDSCVDLRLTECRAEPSWSLHPAPFQVSTNSVYVSSSSTSVRCPSREDRKSEVRQTRGKLHRLRNTVQPPVVTECDYCSGTSLRNHRSTAYQLVHVALCLCHRT